MNKFTLSVYCLLLVSVNIYAQPLISWQKSLGSTTGDYFNSMTSTSDGGYLLVGNASSNDGDVNGLHGSTDFWVTKLDGNGTLLWQKCYGGSGADEATCVTEVTGGYIIAGYTASDDGDVTGNHGTIPTISMDAWVIKINTLGALQWQKCYGGSASETAKGIKLLSSGDLIVSGFSPSTDGDLTGINSQIGVNAWIFKISSTGNLLWSKCYGGGGSDEVPAVALANNGDLVLAGTTTSDTGDVAGNHGAEDVWLIRLNSSGNLLWQKCFGGSLKDYGSSIINAGNDFLITGNTFSNDFDVSGNHAIPDSNDVWVIKVDGSGNLLWQKCYGGTSNDNGKNIIDVGNGNSLITATSNSNNDDVSGNHGSADYWIFKIDSLGAVLWQKSIGGSGYDFGMMSCVTNGNEYATGGWSYSNDGDATNNNGTADFWMVKMEPDITVGINETENVKHSFTVYPNPADNIINFLSSENLEINTLTITNILGEKLFYSNNSKDKSLMDIGFLNEGLYLLQINDEPVTKLIIHHK